jgi:hypothetical protein
MRIEFFVSGSDDSWTVRRGHTRALYYSSCESALRAAEHLARVAAEAGDLAIVTLLRTGGSQESRTFEPAQKRRLELIAAAR